MLEETSASVWSSLLFKAGPVHKVDQGCAHLNRVLLKTELPSPYLASDPVFDLPHSEIHSSPFFVSNWNLSHCNLSVATWAVIVHLLDEACCTFCICSH